MPDVMDPTTQAFGETGARSLFDVLEQAESNTLTSYQQLLESVYLGVGLREALRVHDWHAADEHHVVRSTSPVILLQIQDYTARNERLRWPWDRVVEFEVPDYLVPARSQEDWFLRAVEPEASAAEPEQERTRLKDQLLDWVFNHDPDKFDAAREGAWRQD